MAWNREYGYKIPLTYYICVAKYSKPKVPKKICFGFGKYGYEEGETNAKDFLWSLILEYKSYVNAGGYWNCSGYCEVPEIEEHIREVLLDAGVEEVEFEYPRELEDYIETNIQYERTPDVNGLDYDEATMFINACLSNEGPNRGLLERIVLEDSRVYIKAHTIGGAYFNLFFDPKDYERLVKDEHLLSTEITTQ